MTSIVLISSCAVLDYPKRVAGYSIENFKQEEVGRFAQNFDMSLVKAYNKSFHVLKDLGVREIYNKKEEYIVSDYYSKIFEHCLDSTEVGIFFTQDGEQVKVEVVSNNSRLAKFASERIFARL